MERQARKVPLDLIVYIKKEKEKRRMNYLYLCRQMTYVFFLRQDGLNR